jgi:formylglycine-generating enzyme required for sulfatase activity
MKEILKFLISILILGNITACFQNKSDQELTQGLTFTVNGENFEMIFIEGGTFIMGCTNEQGGDCEDIEKPTHNETLPSFYMGKYEVTQRLWRAVMGADLNQSYNSGCEDCPAEQLSWSDTQEFISKLNTLTGSIFRLPAEAEWEYAARGGKRSKGYKYSGGNNIDEVAWYIDNYRKNKYGKRGTTHPAGMKKPNELGLYDMSGNVWEWCNGWYAKEYYHNGKRVNPDWPFPGTPRFFRRIIRGGSWGGIAKGCRVSYIDYDTENYSDEYGGFRLVLSLGSVQVDTKY